MGGLFDKPQIPTVQLPAPMPDSSSAGVREANRKAQFDILARSGRSSTILTDPANRVGGGDSYSSKTLGGGT
jgi:hypothetical protein